MTATVDQMLARTAHHSACTIKNRTKTKSQWTHSIVLNSAYMNN